jgi:4-amino-4-deoxy-L-arabinose transferase-like glycosyltransferase
MLVVGGAILAAAVLRFATLGHQSLDEDETVTVWLMHHSLGGLLATIPRTESTPPLYYVLAWGWTRAFGTGAVGVRSLSACLGVLTVPVCALAARELGGRRAMVAVALLVACSPSLIWYSQEARAYALLSLTSAAALLWFVRALRGGGRRALGWWAACASLSLLSHYFALFLLAPQALWLLLSAWRGGPGPERRRAAGAVGAVATVGLVLLPLALRQQASGGDQWIGTIPLGGRLADVVPQMLLGDGRPFSHLFVLVLGCCAVAPLLWLLIGIPPTAPPAGRRALALPLVVGVAGIALPVLVDLAGMHILVDRNMMGAAVVLLVALAVGMARCRPAVLGALSLGVVLAMCAWDLQMLATNGMMQREDWRDAARALGSASLPRAILYGPATNNPPPTPPLVPFQAVYLQSMRTMPDRGWTVREIDVLDVRDDLSDTSPPPDPISPGRRWRLVARAGDRRFTLFRFVSARAVLVRPDPLMAANLLSDRDPSETLVGLQVPRAH